MSLIWQIFALKTTCITFQTADGARRKVITASEHHKCEPHGGARGNVVTSFMDICAEFVLVSLDVEMFQPSSEISIPRATPLAWLNHMLLRIIYRLYC